MVQDYPHPFPTLPAPSINEQAALSTQIRFAWDMSLRPSYLKQATKTDGTSISNPQAGHPFLVRD
jgi:hypothetical protein